MRVGRRIHLVDLIIDGVAEGGQNNVVLDDNHNDIRLIVASGAPTTLAASLGAGFGVSQPLHAAVYAGLVRVYHDQHLPLMSPGRDSTGYMPALRSFKFTVPLNMDIEFTGTAASSVSGLTIVLAAVSDSSATIHPGFTYGTYRLRFTDL